MITSAQNKCSQGTQINIKLRKVFYVHFLVPCACVGACTCFWMDVCLCMCGCRDNLVLEALELLIELLEALIVERHEVNAVCEVTPLLEIIRGSKSKT